MTTAIKLSYIFILYTFAGCKKDKEPNYTLPVDGLSYVQLPLGKYFIYKDSATTTLDSVVVTESELRNLHTTNQSAFGQFSYQEYRLKLSKIDNLGSSRWLSGVATALLNSTNLSMNSTFSPDGRGGYLIRYPSCNCDVHDKNDKIISSMIVEGKTYTNVILTTRNSYDDAYYWARGVGLIKYVRANSSHTTYTLLRHN